MIRIFQFTEIHDKFSQPTFQITFSATGAHEKFFKRFRDEEWINDGTFADERVLRLFLSTLPDDILFPYLAEVAANRLQRKT